MCLTINSEMDRGFGFIETNIHDVRNIHDIRHEHSTVLLCGLKEFRIDPYDTLRPRYRSEALYYGYPTILTIISGSVPITVPAVKVWAEPTEQDIEISSSINTRQYEQHHIVSSSREVIESQAKQLLSIHVSAFDYSTNSNTVNDKFFESKIVYVLFKLEDVQAVGLYDIVVSELYIPHHDYIMQDYIPHMHSPDLSRINQQRLVYQAAMNLNNKRD